MEPRDYAQLHPLRRARRARPLLRVTMRRRLLPLFALCRSVTSTAVHPPLRPPRAIALDLDGTLFNSAGDVSQLTCRALRTYVEQGGTAVLATGRGRSTAVRVASELEAVGVVIECIVCSDGAIALQRNTHGRSPEDAWSILWTDMRPGREYPLDALRAALPGASFCAEVDGLGGSIIDSEHYISTIRERSPAYAARFFAGRHVTPDFDRVFGAAERVGWLRAIPASASEADAEKLCACVAAVLSREAPRSELHVALTTVQSLRGLGALTILRRGTDKSRGLAAVSAALGIEAADVLAFGDHNNDLGMFEWAGQSLCPANANERAKAAATLCSHLSNDEDFIVDALEGVKHAEARL